MQDLEAFACKLETTLPEAIATQDLQGCVRDLQLRWQRDILPLPPEALPPAQATAWQTLQTELHRQLRLLQTETMLLQAARQPQTRQQRLQNYRTRLQGAIAQARSLLEA